MFPNNGKDRLWIIFQHRGKNPGFHWAFLLSPKNESNDTWSTAYDITNSILMGADGTGNWVDLNPDSQWRYRGLRQIQPLRLGDLICRALIAKPKPGLAQAIEDVLSKVGIREGDTCRIWLLRALTVLKGLFPDIPDPSTLEAPATAFAERSKALLVGPQPTLWITNIADYPVADFRER
ncbi:hypothetical protein FRB94_006037 [Tulasnella sp. JGI-2019a]|nr:hypothetical protein FRB93_001032 [Tulasnella sp. JGI-2019a]KAG9012422.1 hypothetical protein FRB94_006037 [Tulasnella sp. JGI-2019a]KAG9027597.1 hypothetical protein FRB95_007593 [Tulasnella sp. JGI-2019a]